MFNLKNILGCLYLDLYTHVYLRWKKKVALHLMIAQNFNMVIKLKLFNGEVTNGKFLEIWQMCFEVDFFIITFFFIMDTLICHWLECLFIICCERVYICTFNNVSCNQAKITTSALIHTVAALQQYYNLFKLEYRYMYLYLVITCKQNKQKKDRMSALIHFPSHSDPAQVCVCVCCEYSTPGGQRVYCSTLLHFTLFFRWDRRSFTLIDLSAYKSLVCVPVYLCVRVYMCWLSNIVLCDKEVKDQILLSISILDNINPLWSHTQNLTLSKNDPPSWTHFIP